MTEDDVTFMITPRINAASRMGKPEDAFKLLSTTNMLEAVRLAEHLEKINNERKGTVAALVKEAKKHLEAREKINSVIVVGNPEWRPITPRPCSQLSRRRIYATGVCVGKRWR